MQPLVQAAGVKLSSYLVWTQEPPEYRGAQTKKLGGQESLINCPECDQEISRHAQACPGCGFPLSEKAMRTRVWIPAIPTEVYAGLLKAKEGYPFLEWEVRVGDWVKEYQPIAHYNVRSFEAHHFARGKIATRAQLRSPVSGRISVIQRIESAEWAWSDLEALAGGRWSWGESISEHAHLKDDAMLCAVDTIEEIDSVYAYEVYEHIVDYGYFARSGADAHPLSRFIGIFRGSDFDPSDFPPSVLEGLANARCRIEKL